MDDSLLNVRGSQALGWNSWLYDEQGTSAGKVKEGELSGVVSSLQGGSASAWHYARRKLIWLSRFQTCAKSGASSSYSIGLERAGCSIIWRLQKGSIARNVNARICRQACP